MLKVVPVAALLPRLLGVAALAAVALLYCMLAFRINPFLLLLSTGLLFLIYALLGSPHQVVVDAERRVWARSLIGRRALGRLEDLKGIEVRKEVRGSGKSRHVVHPVALDLGHSKLELAAPHNYLQARRVSERLARVLEADITDAGDGQPVFRSRLTLDARWVNIVSTPDSLAPTPARLRLERGAPELLVQLPRADPSRLVLGAALCLFIPLLLALEVDPLAVGLISLVPLGFAVVYHRYLRACFTGPRLEAGPGRLLADGQKINLDKLEEIRDLPGGLFFLSDEKLVWVPTSLSRDEAEWLYGALARVLKAFS